MKLLKKKNGDYSAAERKSTALMTSLLFMMLGFVVCSNSTWFDSNDWLSNFAPYLIGILLGMCMGYVGYRFPKAIHIILFSLPLAFLGS